MPFFKIFLGTLLYTFFLDMIWLGYIAKHIYAENIGNLLRNTDGNLTPNWPAAAIVYLAIAIGITCFVLPRATEGYLSALMYGALFGAVTYGIYDFTNFSILANWPLKITLIDFVWGIFLCGASSVFAKFIQQHFGA